MFKVWKAGLFVLACGFATVTLDASWAGAKTTQKSKASAGSGTVATTSKLPSADKDDEVREVLIGLEAAMGAQSGENAAVLFAEDVHFIDQAGEEIRGRDALRARFEHRLKAGASHAVGVHPQNIAFPAETVALVVGEVSRKQGQEDLPASRFSMVLAKKAGKWQIVELHETAIQTVQSANQLQELDWLVGEWTAQRPDVTARLSFEWEAGKKFILSKTAFDKNGKTSPLDRQVIGWDPQHNNIISWHFDGNGGFGNGTWTKSAGDNQWNVHVTGVGADGSNSIASNVFTVKSPDEFVWQSVHRSLDGTPVADSEPITVRRVKH